MGTVFVPTKANQDESNARLATVEAKVDALASSIASAQMAQITVRLNWTGQTYDVPTDATIKADVLNGAKIILREQGVATPYEAHITSLTNFETTFTVFVTQGAKAQLNSVGALLGKSPSAGYLVAADQFLLQGGDHLTIYLNSRLVTGSVVELFRVQPYVANPSGSADQRLKLGNSYLGSRITTATGTTVNLGHWTQGMGQWVDESLVKVRLWDCPADGSTPTERVITTAADTTGWMELDETLDVIKNIAIGTLTFTGDSATVGDNRIVRYDQLWIKTVRETVDMPIADESGDLVSNPTDCIVRYYANTQIDSSYHLHPLFVKYAKNGDGTYTATPCAHGYLPRYPLGNTTKLVIGGENVDVPQFKTGNGREYTPGKRSVALDVCRRVNRCTIKLYFDDDGDGTEELFATIEPDETNRTFGVSGTAEVSFMQWMSYLFFGVNVQGAASTTDETQNVFPGICTDAVAATTNGATDHIVNSENHETWGFKVWSGAVNTRLCTNSIVFLGVEDATWSSQGLYWEDMTMVTRRTITTDSTGAISSNVESTAFLFAQDAADVHPGATSISNETTELESASFEGELKGRGYREVSVLAPNSSQYWYRAAADTSEVLCDICLPSAVADNQQINYGGCDYFYRGGTPGNFAAFSASTAYAVGEFVIYESKLYKCTAAHAAGAWNADHFALFASSTVTRRSYWLVALGGDRSDGAGLGSGFACAGSGFAYSNGRYWRTRPFLRTVS